MRRWAMAVSGSFASLASLVACAGLLGFEDIVEEQTATGPDASPDVAPLAPDAGDASPARRCSPTAEIKRRTPLATLVDPSFDGEIWPRLTRNELTITFSRFAKGGAPYLMTCFIAQRASRDVPFDSARPLFADVTPTVRFCSPTPDGSRFYVVRDNGPAPVILTAAADGGPLEPLPGQSTTGRNHPQYLDTTTELFFGADDSAGFTRIVRRIGVGAQLGASEEIRSIYFEGADKATTSYSEPVLSDDGRHLYYTRFNPGEDGGRGTGTVFVVTRNDVGVFTDRQEPPGLPYPDVRLGALSPDGCRLYTYRIEAGMYRLFVEERDPE